MRAGDVKIWLDQGPAILLEECEVEDPILISEAILDDVVPTTEIGWIIHLLSTGEILSVHTETLHNGESDPSDEQKNQSWSAGTA